MGTRNLTIVKVDGKIKVRQYCQWDGYPTGVGQHIVNYLKSADLNKLKENVKKLKFGTDAEISKAYADVVGHNRDSVTGEESEKIKKDKPELHRDTGPGVLKIIESGAVTMVSDGGPFNPESWCEYAYTLDLDKEKITVQWGHEKDQKKTFTFKQFKDMDMKYLENCINEGFPEPTNAEKFITKEILAKPKRVAKKTPAKKTTKKKE